MRRVALLAALLLGWAAPTVAQTPAPPTAAPVPAAPRQLPREVTVANNTDRTLRELYLYAPNAEPGPDRLGTSVLPPRATLRIPLARGEGCSQEVRAVLEDGEEMRRRQDLCRNPRIALADTGPRRELTLANDTDQTLREFYVSAPGAREPGPDRLGSSTVGAGESQAVRLRNLPGCTVDLRAVFEDDSAQTRERVDICRNPRVAFADTGPRRDVTVTNRARRTLRELYARPAGATPWGPDRLGTSMLSANEVFRLRLRGEACAYDLRAVFDNDQEEVRRNTDVCAETSLAFAGRAAGEARRLTLVNNHGATIQQVFVSAADQGEWGEDALGSDVLAVGRRQEIGAEVGCRADLRIVFASGAAEERRDVDLCGVATIAFRPGWTLDAQLGAPAAPTGPQPGRALLRNTGAVPVVEIYADAPGAARGADRLGATVLGVGEALDFMPPEELVRDGARCPADLVAVFRDGRELSLAARDLCAGEEIALQ